MQVSLLPMVVDFSVLTDSIFALLLMITVSFQTCGFMKEVCFYEQEAYFYIRKFPFFCLNFLWLFVIFSCALIGHSSYLHLNFTKLNYRVLLDTCVSQLEAQTKSHTLDGEFYSQFFLEISLPN